MADQYGFGRYSIVLHAPVAIAMEVQRFRAMIGMAHMTTEPHVSIVSGIVALTDRDELLNRLRKIATEQPAIRITFTEPLLELAGRGSVGGVVPSSELVAMRAEISRRLPGIVSTSQPLDHSWRPHLTIYQSDDSKVRVNAERLASTLNLEAGFDAASLDLVGRLGSPPGGTQEIIATIPLPERD